MLCSKADVVRAFSKDEALRLRAAHPAACVIAGGTDVMVFLESGRFNPGMFLDIWGCRDLAGVEDRGDRLFLGARTTWTEVGEDGRLPEALRDCAKTIGAAQIQNRGTVGGNLVNASPAGDSLPMWLALGADIHVASLAGERTVPADRFFLGYRRVDVRPDELVVGVSFAKVPGRLVYRKVGTRLAQAIAKVTLGAFLGEGVVRVALGAVAPTPLRLPAVEAAILRGERDPGVLRRLVGEGIVPIDDIRSTEAYRRRVAENLVVGLVV